MVMQPPHEQDHTAGPDVTMATQAAFAAVNDMFIDNPRGIPQMLTVKGHGRHSITVGHSAGCSPAPGMHTEPAGNMEVAEDDNQRSAADLTMATRCAFDAVNSMFHGALPHDAPWPGNPAEVRAKRLPRVSMGGNLTGRPLGKAQMDHRRQPRKSMMAEPTVTISTRAAFDALNDMFKAQLPHEGAGSMQNSFDTDRAVPHNHTSVAKLSTTSAAPAGSETLQSCDGGCDSVDARLQPVGSELADFAVYEDTQFLHSRGQREPPPSTEEGEAGLTVYEDTMFVGQPAGPSRVLPCQQLHGKSLPAGDCLQEQQANHGFEIYEDTRFMKENTGAPSSGLQVFADTSFTVQADGEAAPADQAGGQLGGPAVDSNTAQGGPVDMGMEYGLQPHAETTLNIYEDTNQLPRDNCSALHTAALHGAMHLGDITAAMSENMPPPPAVPTAQPSWHQQGLDVFQNQVCPPLLAWHP
jgi:hypothetical protein